MHVLQVVKFVFVMQIWMYASSEVVVHASMDILQELKLELCVQEW